MAKYRVPIIVGGEIRWLETGNAPGGRGPAQPTATGGGLRGAVDRALFLARDHARPIATGASVVILVCALFVVLQYLGPSWSPLLLSLAGIVAIFSCLGTRRSGTLSAYSIFNEGTQRLPGQLSADDIEREIRGGGMAVPQQAPQPAGGRGMRLGDGRRAEVDPDEASDGDEGDGVADAEGEEDRCGEPRGPCRWAVHFHLASPYILLVVQTAPRSSASLACREVVRGVGWLSTLQGVPS
jgi:hypothetical protein